MEPRFGRWNRDLPDGTAIYQRVCFISVKI
jgi:hypothetical protein